MAPTGPSGLMLQSVRLWHIITDDEVCSTYPHSAPYSDKLEDGTVQASFYDPTPDQVATFKSAKLAWQNRDDQACGVIILKIAPNLKDQTQSHLTASNL
ncbi:hypothetical protein AX17_004762 [Amanita inopinata Kibby_2008]|nr:hypothetical protein AX17_004762 [Amanita inopinata Kibby_2008]